MWWLLFRPTVFLGCSLFTSLLFPFPCIPFSFPPWFISPRFDETLPSVALWKKYAYTLSFLKTCMSENDFSALIPVVVGRKWFPFSFSWSASFPFGSSVAVEKSALPPVLSEVCFGLLCPWVPEFYEVVPWYRSNLSDCAVRPVGLSVLRICVLRF